MHQKFQLLFLKLGQENLLEPLPQPPERFHVHVKQWGADQLAGLGVQAVEDGETETRCG